MGLNGKTTTMPLNGVCDGKEPYQVCLARHRDGLAVLTCCRSHSLVSPGLQISDSPRWNEISGGHHICWRYRTRTGGRVSTASAR